MSRIDRRAPPPPGQSVPRCQGLRRCVLGAVHLPASREQHVLEAPPMSPELEKKGRKRLKGGGKGGRFMAKRISGKQRLPVDFPAARRKEPFRCHGVTIESSASFGTSANAMVTAGGWEVPSGVGASGPRSYLPSRSCSDDRQKAHRAHGRRTYAHGQQDKAVFSPCETVIQGQGWSPESFRL